MRVRALAVFLSTLAFSCSPGAGSAPPPASAPRPSSAELLGLEATGETTTWTVRTTGFPALSEDGKHVACIVVDRRDDLPSDRVFIKRVDDELWAQVKED